VLLFSGNIAVCMKGNIEQLGVIHWLFGCTVQGLFF
jgi:hypothetical protein